MLLVIPRLAHVVQALARQWHVASPIIDANEILTAFIREHTKAEADVELRHGSTRRMGAIMILEDCRGAEKRESSIY